MVSRSRLEPFHSNKERHDHIREETMKALIDKGYVRANDRQEGGSHYKDMGVEPWGVVDTWSLEQRIGYYRGSALKYLMRMGTKDARLQEAKKAAHYLEKLIETLHDSRSESAHLHPGGQTAAD